MLLSPILALLAFALPPQPHSATLTTADLLGTAHKLARDEGWPIDQKGYTLDPMQPVADESFYSIGLYRDAHLLRMYSIHRQTGDIVDFMRGCDLIQFDDVKDLQYRIRKTSGSSSLPADKLAVQVGCPKLNIVNSRWVH
jgi:hypothetical protein